MRLYGGLNQGEGIVGGADVAMETSGIYTCMGIAFANRATARGGLYHYPAEAVGTASVAATIRQMYNDVAPDIVTITPARTTSISYRGSSQGDIDRLEQFVRGLGAAQVIVAPPAAHANLFWRDGAPLFSQPGIPGNATDAYVDDQVRAVLQTQPREVRAGIWYYGADGETVALEAPPQAPGVQQMNERRNSDPPRAPRHRAWTIP